MSIRYVIEPNNCSVGKQISEHLWESLVREFFIGYKYVGFSGIKEGEQLGDDESRFNLQAQQLVIVTMEWSKKHGIQIDREEFMLYETNNDFFSYFFSIPLRSWTKTNFTFENIFFLREKEDINGLVFVEGDSNSFTIFSDSNDIPLGVKLADKSYEEHCIIYDDVVARFGS